MFWGWNLGFFITIIQGWPTQSTLEGFENLLADQEVIDKKMSWASVKNEKEVLFTNKKRHRFRRHTGGGSIRDIDKLKGHQHEGSSQRKFEGNCYTTEIRAIRWKIAGLKESSKRVMLPLLFRGRIVMRNEKPKHPLLLRKRS